MGAQKSAAVSGKDQTLPILPVIDHVERPSEN
jgi:hypothetical protein